MIIRERYLVAIRDIFDNFENHSLRVDEIMELIEEAYNEGYEA